MSRETPQVYYTPFRVKEDTCDLVLSPWSGSYNPGVMYAVGSVEWFDWLLTADKFQFNVAYSSIGFSARREIRRGSSYWYAYRRVAGKLRKRYLGDSSKFSAEFLFEFAKGISAY